jgi:hypothetical protein
MKTGKQLERKKSFLNSGRFFYPLLSVSPLHAAVRACAFGRQARCVPSCMKNLLAFLSISFSLFSCAGNNEPQTPGDSLHKNDSAATTISNNAGIDPHYFDYSNTTLTDDFTDTVFAHFSSEESEDRFTFFVPKGKIYDTKSVLRITTKEGELIYEAIFPTHDFVYGYGTSEVKSEKEMVEYILVDARAILQEGIVDPRNDKDNSFLSQFSADSFERYDIYEEAKSSGRMLFHYRLGNESHYVLGYSVKEKKVVTALTCC